jgi:succinate-acetate transporter protein
MSNQLANPAPLGLMGFGVTTVLLNLHNAGFYLLGPMILSMGIFYGGLAQIIAGIMEYKKGNSFGTLAFTSYGLFWLSFVFINLLPNSSLWSASSGSSEIGFYLLLWGIFTFLMFFGTLKLNRALQVVFLTLTILFFLLAIGDFTGITPITVIAGYEGILCGASAIYLSIAEILNEIYGRTILPIGSR